MFRIVSSIALRIISNSYSNVFQKFLTNSGIHSSYVNFYNYFGLSVLSLLLIPFCKIQISTTLIINFILMGILGSAGNYYIIKALSIGELSVLAPINSYKPVVAMLFAFIYLKEIPSIQSIIGIILIIFGTYILYSLKNNYNKIAVFYRILALIFSGSEAVIIKKLILMTDVKTSFVLWCFAGLIFSAIFAFCSKHKIKKPDLKYLIFLIISVSIMQYSTNYVFSKMNTAYALAIFQLSTLLSVFLGSSLFKETDLKQKIIASAIMIIGAVIIILN